MSGGWRGSLVSPYSRCLCASVHAGLLTDAYGSSSKRSDVLLASLCICMLVRIHGHRRVRAHINKIKVKALIKKKKRAFLGS